ncbi:MAG: ral secretion pathway protein GspG [Herbaspirillum sp.]|nr:ral secretion pathway protein GspG [Herbaspirillum sp.]
MPVQRRHAGRQRGFTLIELLVTLAIMAVLAMVAMPVAQVSIQRSRERELQHSEWEIRDAIDAYHRAGDDGRIAKPLGSNGYPKNLEILVNGVPDQRDPNHSKIYFLRRIPRDPMNPDTALSASASWGKRNYASEADDPQEGDDVYDVYSTSTQTGLNGEPYNKW